MERKDLTKKLKNYQLKLLIHLENSYLLKSKLIYQIFRLSLKLQALLNKYQQKVQIDSKAEIKLADQILLKQLLIAKIQREMQGFRTSPGEYKELENVNPDDVTRIIHQIKMKIDE